MIVYPIFQCHTSLAKRVPLPIKLHRVNIWPNDHELHVSYGKVLIDIWQNAEDEIGLLWIEGDIAITPEHLYEIDRELSHHSDIVVTVPYLLYPKTTGRTWPIWSNRGITPEGVPIAYEYSQKPPARPAFFSLGCTYMPACLLDNLDTKRGNWDYPCLDTRLSETARARGVPVIATPTPALHLHY